VKGAKASASLYSLVQSARANNLEPYAYLRRLFAKLPTAKSVEDFESLLPWDTTRDHCTVWKIERLQVSSQSRASCGSPYRIFHLVAP
jgi:hypothetical protein